MLTSWPKDRGSLTPLYDSYLAHYAHAQKRKRFEDWGCLLIFSKQTCQHWPRRHSFLSFDGGTSCFFHRSGLGAYRLIKAQNGSIQALRILSMSFKHYWFQNEGTLWMALRLRSVILTNSGSFKNRFQGVKPFRFSVHKKIMLCHCRRPCWWSGRHQTLSDASSGLWYLKVNSFSIAESDRLLSNQNISIWKKQG